MQSFIGICLLLWIGHELRTHIPLLRKLYLPACVIAGILGLAAIQISLKAQGLTDAQLDQCWIAPWIAGWGKLPGFLINIVFACLFLGVTLPKLKVVFGKAGPQLAYGQIVAWGQYVVGMGVALLFLQGKLSGLSEKAQNIFGALIPVGFEGGHGTAAGLKTTFEQYDWASGSDFALASATVGIISAIVVGMVLVNWAVRAGHVAGKTVKDTDGEDLRVPIIPVGQRPAAGKLTVNPDAIETLTLQISIVAVAILFGWLIKQAMMSGVSAYYGDIPEEVLKTKTLYKLARPFPLFPLCMIGGLIVQMWEQKFDSHNIICGDLMKRIQGTALDFLVVAAIATIKIRTLGSALAPFVILVSAGILWNIFCVVFLARRVFKNAWFERSIAEMGQSMGVTATGLLLLRVVDPEYKTPAAEAFAAKQILHEPFMGGGLWTSAAIPIAAMYGGWRVFTIAAIAIGVWLIVIGVMRKVMAKAV